MASIPELHLWCRGTDLEPLWVLQAFDRSRFVSCWLTFTKKTDVYTQSDVEFCLFLQSWIAKKSKFTVEFSHLIKRWAPLKQSEKQKETQRAAEGPSFSANDDRCWWLFYDITTKYTVVAAYSVNHLVLEKTPKRVLFCEHVRHFLNVCVVVIGIYLFFHRQWSCCNFTLNARMSVFSFTSSKWVVTY